MNSVDRTFNCILPSVTLTYPYLEYVNTLFGSLMSQDSKKQPITAPKLTVMMPN